MSATIVSSGQTSDSLTANSGGTITVSSGGTIAGAVIGNGGTATILAGGVDSGSTVLSGGTEYVYGSAVGDLISGTQIVSTGGASGLVTSETVFGGGVVSLSVKTTSASDMTIESGGMLAINGKITASDLIVSGGDINLQSPKATISGFLIFSGGTLTVGDNSSAGYGDLAVISGFASGGTAIDLTSATTIGAASATSLTSTTSSGNTYLTISGGGATDTFVFAGTAIGSELTVTRDGAGGWDIVAAGGASAVTSVGSGTTQSNFAVASGATLTVFGGGTIVDAAILSGGSATIDAAGVDSGASIASGGTETVLGSATGDSVSGTQVVGGGGLVSGETVQSGAVLVISGGGTAVNTTIAGGTVELATAQDTVSGSLAFDGPGMLEIAAIPAASAGVQAVISGLSYGDGIAFDTIGSGATLSMTVSGGNTVATVTGGGTSETVTFSGTDTSDIALTASAGTTEITYSAPPITTSYTPGDLVLSIYGDGAGTGAVSLDQAAPITLEEITTTGQVVSRLVLPQTTTVVNGTTEYAISGEYESASEGLLTLSGDGRSLNILGYGVNAAAFDAVNGASIYGTTKLGQTSSIPTGPYTVVPRIVANIGFNATIDTSTSLTGVFTTNNPRSVYTINGTTYYVSGQGSGNDGTQGVFLASDGASSATPIYNTRTDTREVAVVNGQLYVSVDSALNGGGGLYNFGATLPTGQTAPTQLPGIGSSIVLQAGQANSVNTSAVGTPVNLSPEQYYFATPTTLYIADGGDPKEGGIGDGGLQKWTFNGTTWVLDYTLSTGINQVADTAASGTTGLIGLTGTVDGSNVILYATNETVAETDQTYLYAITDTLDATTLPTNESFTLLETAAPGTLIRGVAFAPTSAATAPDITSAVSVAGGATSAGLTFGSGGSVDVQSGGMISGTTLLSGATATISTGGVDSASFIAHGASETVLGSASDDTLDGAQLVSAAGAVVTGETIENGGTLELYLKGGSVSAATVNTGGALLISGNADAIDIVVDGGVVELQSPKATLSGSLAFADAGGTIEATAITSSGYGDLAVIADFGRGDVIDEAAMGSGTTLSTTISGGIVVATLSSGSTTESFTFAGSGVVSGADFASGLSLTSDGGGGTALIYTPPPPVILTVSSGATSSGIQLASGSTIDVLSGGSLSDLTVLFGGSAIIEAGAVDSGSTIQSGGFELVIGSATGGQIFGVQTVSGASPVAVVSNETVHNGGTLELFLKPDVGSDITVMSGGTYLLSGNISAIDTTLDGGAVMEMQSPKSTLSGSLVFSGAATLEATTMIKAGYGDLAVISGWQAGDVIDEMLITASSATLITSVTSDGNTVATISGGSLPESFIFAGTSAASELALVPDGGSGVELQYAAPCFATGTRIATTRGARAVERLRAGERVRTASGALRPVRWVGHRSVDLRRHPRPHDVMPVRVRADAVAPGCPSRDLVLSPDHALFLDGVLIPVRYLLNGATIVQEAATRITWWHAELDSHDVILAEDTPAESYLDTGNRGAFVNAGPTYAIQAHPDFARDVWAAESCAPLVTEGEVLAQVRARLLARLPALGHAVTDDPALRCEAAGGEVLQAQVFDDWSCVVIPDAGRDLTLRSLTFQPAALEIAGSDWRRLGIAVTALRIDGEEIALDAPIFATGWHAAEPGLRWSDGAGVLRAAAGSIVKVRIARVPRYPALTALAPEASAA